MDGLTRAHRMGDEAFQCSERRSAILIMSALVRAKTVYVSGGISKILDSLTGYINSISVRRTMTGSKCEIEQTY